MGKRPRINPKEKTGDKPVKDDQEFIVNLGSNNAKEIITIDEQIKMEIWYDKHYTIRNQHGDADGARIGIHPERIQNLAAISLKHLIFYSSRIKGFAFLNHESEPNTRVILKDTYTDGGALYAVVQIHFKNFNKYECTVITARCDDFKIGSGQYFVEFLSADESILRRIDNGTITEVFSCQD